MRADADLGYTVGEIVDGVFDLLAEKSWADVCGG